MRERVTDLQADLAIQQSIGKDLKENNENQHKQVKTLNYANDFLKSKCTVCNNRAPVTENKAPFIVTSPNSN